jgi:hypothetical protein
MAAPAIYRYKLGDAFTEALAAFARVHAHDDRREYRDAWKAWCSVNRHAVDTEAARLRALGYEGDVEDKIYKAGRYYFRGKAATATPNPRCRYVAASRDVVGAMDLHIAQYVGHDGLTPARGYDAFCTDNSDLLYKEIVRLLREEGLTPDAIRLKIKKTYKNRYFLQRGRLAPDASMTPPGGLQRN